MSDINTAEESAFPVPEGCYSDVGMTLRDYFAAKAMQGALPTRPNGYEMDTAMMARWAYAMADSMLKARQS